MNREPRTENRVGARFPRLYYVAPALLWAGAIFWLSHRTGEELPRVGLPHLDKAAHLAVYAVLGLLVARAWGWGPAISWTVAAGAWAVATLYGLSDEVHQVFVPERTFDLIDLAADAAGAAVGVALWKGRRAKCEVRNP
jgi:VanZ family protein